MFHSELTRGTSKHQSRPNALLRLEMHTPSLSHRFLDFGFCEFAILTRHYKVPVFGILNDRTGVTARPATARGQWSAAPDSL